jgi:hypothetical protein
MKYVVIRDDDASYFTKPKTLELLYGSFFKEKKPINFSVIPKITANIVIDSSNPYRKQEQLEYDPIIPPECRGCDEMFPVNENTEIVEFIQSLESCEVLQHGLTHGLVDGIKEFRINDLHEIERRASLGSKLLQECFHVSPSFFVPPWDNVSTETINFLKSKYKGLSLGRLDPTRLPVKSWGSFLKKILSSRVYMFCDELLLIEHPGYLLTRFSPELAFDRVRNTVETKDIVVLVNHHWEYFFDWSELDSSFFSAWKQVTEYLLSRADLSFLTFSELHKVLMDRNIA